VRPLVRQAWKIDAALNIEGVRALGAAGSLPSDSDQFAPACAFLEYTRVARMIARDLNQPIRVNLSKSTPDTDRAHLAQVAEMLDAKNDSTSKTFASNPRSTIIAEDNGRNVRQILDQGPSNVVFRMDPQHVTVFGQRVDIPSMDIALSAASAQVVHKDISTIKTGDHVEIEWLPAEGFSWSVSY
jgi:hypothetical protein